jgi:hypothetical protein
MLSWFVSITYHMFLQITLVASLFIKYLLRFQILCRKTNLVVLLNLRFWTIFSSLYGDLSITAGLPQTIGHS